jgi:tetratricopeptide (TPR) repeat protein
MAVKPAEAGLQSALRELGELGFDSELENIRCLVRVEQPAGKYERWLRDLALERKRRPGRSAEWLAVEGKLLIGAGRLDEARALLESAIPSAPRLPAATWLGECLILEGRFDEALKVLEGSRQPWSSFFRAAARLALGDLRGARVDCESFLLERRGAAGLGLRAVLSAQEKKWKEAQADLDAAALASPDQSWPMELCAAVYQSAGDLPGAKKALMRALAIQPSARLHAELAKVNEKLGIIPEALENAGLAAGLQPCPEYHSLKAHLHVCWREYDEAAQEYGLALGFGADAALLFLRSKAHASGGHMIEALADAEAAVLAHPGDAHLSAWKVQLLTVNGLKPKARKEMSALERVSKPLALFSRGYAALFERDYSAAARAFSACTETGQGEAIARKARFYRTVAQALSVPGPKERAGEQLYLIGMGVNPPYSATAEGLRALSRCDVIFNNVMDEENFEILRPFCSDCRPVAYHQNNDEGRLSDLMMAEVRRGRTVGFVTRGNALVYGPLGTELRRRCVAARHSWRCFPAVCSFDMFSARCETGAGVNGMTVLDSSALREGTKLDTKAPLIVYLDMKMSEERYRQMCANLEVAYGKTRECLIFDHVVDQAPMLRTCGELSSLFSTLSFSAILHIPGMAAS